METAGYSRQQFRWIEEELLTAAEPKQTLEGLNNETNPPERRDTKNGL
jgi:hypothetical protein